MKKMFLGLFAGAFWCAALIGCAASVDEPGEEASNEALAEDSAEESVAEAVDALDETCYDWYDCPGGSECGGEGVAYKYRCCKTGPNSGYCNFVSRTNQCC